MAKIDVRQPVTPSYAQASAKWQAWPRGRTSTLVTSNNRVYYIPIDLPRATDFIRIGVNVVSTPGGSGSVGRLGAYSDSSNSPGARLFEASGTVDLTATGSKELTIAQTLPAGRSWLAVVTQGTPTPNPTLRALDANMHDPTIPLTAQSDDFGTALVQLNVSGGLPDPAVPSSVSTPPLIYLKVA